MKAAFIKKDITPQEPCHMAGYARPGLSTGVLDPIEVNAVAAEIQGKLYTIGILDSIMLEEGFCREVTAQVAQDTGVDPEHLTVSAIHTHSAPSFFKMTFEDNVVETKLQNQAKDALASAMQEALSSLAECRAELEEAEIEGLYGNRNVKGGVEDKHVYLLSFYNNADERIGALFNISAHPTILNGSSTVLSADLLGHIRSLLQEQLSCPVAITNGCCGDVSTRFYRHSSGMEELETTAQAVVDQFQAKRHSVPLAEGPVASRTFSMVSHFDAHTDPDWALMMKEMLEDKSPQSEFFLGRLRMKESFGAYDLKLIAQLRLFGNLLFVVLPGDVLSGFGCRIKKAFPSLHVVIICYSNTYCNYLVPEEEYGKYFETYNSRLARGEADAFIDEVISQAKEMMAESCNA